MSANFYAYQGVRASRDTVIQLLNERPGSMNPFTANDSNYSLANSFQSYILRGSSLVITPDANLNDFIIGYRLTGTAMFVGDETEKWIGTNSIRTLAQFAADCGAINLGISIPIELFLFV